MLGPIVPNVAVPQTRYRDAPQRSNNGFLSEVALKGAEKLGESWRARRSYLGAVA